MNDFEIETLRRKNVGYAVDVESRIQCGVLLSLITEVQKSRRDTAASANSAPSGDSRASEAKSVATVRVTNKGYSMVLSTYIAYALPEGTHELFAAPLPASEPTKEDTTEVTEAQADLYRHFRYRAEAMGYRSLADVFDHLSPTTPSSNPEDDSIVDCLQAWRNLPEVAGYVKPSFEVWVEAHLKR